MNEHSQALIKAAEELRALERRIGERIWRERFDDAERIARNNDVCRFCFGAIEWGKNIANIVSMANMLP